MTTSTMATKDALLEKALRHRWLVWAFLIIPYIMTFFHRMGVSAVKDELTAIYGLSATSFGAIGAMYFYAYSIAQIPTGLLVDTVGSRVTTGCGMMIAAIGSFVFGYASDTTMLYIGRILIGLGVSVCYVSLMKIQSQWFREKEFGTLAGACLFLGNLGSLFAQAPMSFLVSKVSFGTAFSFMGVIAALSGLGCFLFVRNKPQDCGYPPINEAQQGTVGKTSVMKALQATLTHKDNIAPIIFYFCMTATFFSFAGTWGISYVKSVYGIETTDASHILSLLIIGFMSGCFIIGFASDKLSTRKKALIIPSAGLVILWSVLTFWNGGKPPQLALYPLMFGLGFCMGTVPPVMGLGKEVNAKQYTGTAIALLNTFSALSGAVVTGYFGKILDINKHLPPTEQYQKTLLLLLVFNVCSLIAACLCKETNCRNIYQEPKHTTQH